MLPRLHLLMGVLSLLVFLLTGQYMARVLNVPMMDDVSRLLYRSSHLYIFYAAVANILIGLYYRPVGKPHWLAWINGAFILTVPVILIHSFFAEAGLGLVDRDGAFYGGVLLFIAVANAVAARLWLWWRSSSREAAQ